MLAVFGAMLLAFTAFQSSAPNAPAKAAASHLPEGLSMTAKLKSNLWSKGSKVGDAVELELIREVKDADGKVLLPDKARLVGTVTLVQRKTKDDQAAIAIHITEAKWKGGSVLFEGFLGTAVLVKSSNLSFFDPSLTSRRGGSGDTHATDDMDSYPCMVQPDEKYGRVMRANREIDLKKGEAVLEIVTF